MIDHRARALTNQALEELKSALEAADTAEDFLAHADIIVGREQNTLELPLDLGIPDRLEVDKGLGRDAKNAPRVYEYLGALDPANAADRRLWTYLAFSTYRAYMEERWPLDVETWKGRVRDRWLLTKSSRGPLVRHGISRLWWVASLTYDPSLEYALSRAGGDPFAYTREAFRNEDRLNSLFDREAGALPDLVRSVLEHAALGGGREKDKHIGALMMDITLVYGYRDLSTLDREGIASLVADSAPALPAI